MAFCSDCVLKDVVDLNDFVNDRRKVLSNNLVSIIVDALA